MKFVKPKYSKRQKVSTPDGDGEIVEIRHYPGVGYYYLVNDKYYHETELE